MSIESKIDINYYLGLIWEIAIYHKIYYTKPMMDLILVEMILDQRNINNKLPYQ